jgi:hypothetical protein
MAETFKFRDRILELVGSKAHVLERAEKLLGTTHAITKAADASKIPRADVQRHVIDTVIAAARQIVEAPLSELIDAHSEAVEDEYALLEGDPPEDEAGLADWLKYLADFAAPTFNGEVKSVIGPEALGAWLHDPKADGFDLAQLLVSSPVENPAAELKVLGVTTADLERLTTTILENRMPPQKAAAPARDEPKAPAAPRKRAPSVDSPNAVTEATRNALVALSELTSLKEGDIASALGVSRPQANNYRHGKTLLAPTDEQAANLLGLFDDVIGKLRAAREALDLAILGG